VIDHPIAFIAGLHRSGTSLVHQILRDHPDVSGFRNTGVPQDEGQHLQNIVPPARAFGGPGRFGFDPRCYLDENSSLCTPENAAGMWACWRGHWDTSRSLLVEKSPPNLVRTRFLQRLFPNSSFIVVVRNPFVVAMATQKWAASSPVELIRHWIVCHRKFEADRCHLARVRVVRYEDLVQRPDETVCGIYDFLGLRRHAISAPIRPGLNDEYLAAWHSHLEHTPGAAQALQSLQPEFAALAERYGYAPD
jgi:Sulfotransferase family